MNDMRKLINLMEGVRAVPGIGTEKLDEYIRTDSPLRDKEDYRARMKELQAIQMDPNTARDPRLKAELTRKKVMLDTQAREMGFVSEGSGQQELGVGASVYPRWDQKGEPFKIVGMTQSGKWVCVDDYGNKGMMAGEDLVVASAPELAAEDIEKPAQVVSCDQSNPAAARDACAMEEGAGEYDKNFITSAVKDGITFARNSTDLYNIVSKETGYPNTPEFQALINSAVNDYFGSDRTVDTDQGITGDEDMMLGLTHDEGPGDYGMAEDISNGYDEVHYASGNDYFPNGADSPVVKAVGPSGARHGDNPEQKKMQVAEAHKELVYAYRGFLKESAKPKKFDPTNDPYVNKWGHLGVAGNTIDSDDMDAWRAEEARIKKLKAKDAAKDKAKKKIVENQQSVISKIEVQDFNGDFEHDGANVTFNGSVSFAATVLGQDGQPLEIGFDLDIVAKAPYEWDYTEQPTSWNHAADGPNYSGGSQAAVSTPIFANISLSNGTMIVDGNEVSAQDAQQYLDPNVFKAILNPALYQSVFSQQMNAYAEKMDPPESDGPDYDDRDRDY